METVAAAVGTDKSNLRRVEEGLQVPQQSLARNLFKYYGGAVPLGSIYDPKFDNAHA